MRKALLLFSPLLTACFPPEVPSSFELEMQRPDAHTAVVTLTPPPPVHARYSIREAADCGAEDGPELAFGTWPAHVPTLTVQARRGHLLTVEAAGVRVEDCVPPVSWNSAQSVKRR